LLRLPNLKSDSVVMVKQSFLRLDVTQPSVG
jgi:hypothetical protein